MRYPPIIQFDLPLAIVENEICEGIMRYSNVYTHLLLHDLGVGKYYGNKQGTIASKIILGNHVC